MNSLDWNDLQTFLAIAETGSLSAAARQLGVTQPTMGRRLKALEQRAGARLLQSMPRGFVLTPLGEQILGHAQIMREQMDSAERAISGGDMRLEGVVRITTVEMLAGEIVVPAMAALCQEHPGISLELVPGSRSFNLSKREADIALRVAPFEGQSLISRRVGYLRHRLYASVDRAARQPRLSDWPDDAPLLTVMEDQMHLPQIRWLHQKLPNAQICFRSNARHLQAQAAAQGLGLALLPELVEQIVPGLARIESDDLPDHPPVHLGVHRDLRDTPRIRAAMDAIIARAAAILG
ncbi:LysR family transcriptional regulator [Alterisphingorhabdus coralli]|uniref:LysR family transcriptional regulator n=1 Tax=Alterisphingorhabdus coralli TaxID=3071408 RepID=A0AA97F9V8_9SPHN|nr:LysR family transcriptional regulator [Parasphingorhabdus sp. SCSIO 66989]WOE75937.1 LysR family transcriptional regulator [Parasphingorhabdus sp. SCSIO 66989]